MFRPTVSGYVIPAEKTAALLRRFPDFGEASTHHVKDSRAIDSRSVFERSMHSMVSNTKTVSGLALIGASGPQLFKPSVPGFVIPADETEDFLRMIPDFGGAFAGGGSPPMGRRSLGGEEGVEVFVPATVGKRWAEDARGARGRGGGDTNITVAVQGSIDRRTRHQIANDIAREQRAAGRLA